MVHYTPVQRLTDIAESAACRVGLMRHGTWAAFLADPHRRLYAGKLRRGLPQYGTSWGITPFYVSKRNILHDVAAPYPIPDASVAHYQSEDVFEHVDSDRQPALLAEIHRVLRPGAIFRLSLPDYHFPLYRDRTQRDAAGALLFDPGGDGRLEDGKVVDGGHVWFPTIDSVRALIDASPFRGHATFLHYNRPDGSFEATPIDYGLGHIARTPDHDPRGGPERRPISLVVDAVKR